jgi:hypothetical protein
MKKCVWSGCVVPQFLTSAPGVTGQLHDVVALPLGRILALNNWVGGWVFPRSGLDAVEKGKISCPSQYHTLAIQPVAGSSAHTEQLKERVWNGADEAEFMVLPTFV